MSKVAFFGHRRYDYEKYTERIRGRIEELVEKGANEFYNGFRGDFDKICAKIVFGLKNDYPHIKNVLVLSYRPAENFSLPQYFDESVYLLEGPVPPRFAIWRTNRKVVELVDFVVSGVVFSYGGAKEACDYAKRKNKSVINMVS